ncbi:MAG: hypothetical protein WBD36_01845 [Bacteroidota bacterium]
MFILGAVLQLFLASRSWIGGDQVHLLNLGLDFSLHHHLQPFAKMMSGAGANPGALLQLLVGIPLLLMPHFHSPMLLIVVFHIVAGVVFISVVNGTMGPKAACFATVVYWLSPWRLYNGGFLWEPAYLFLPAAAHLWACWHLRERAGFVPSAVVLFAIVASMQIHNSAFVLVVLTIVLLLRHSIRLGFSGAIVGTLVGLITMIPTIHSFVVGTLPPAQASEGYIGRSLVLVYPALKGILYWFTLGSLDVVRQLNETMFLTQGGPLSVAMIRILQFFCVLSVGISIVASWWYFRPLWSEDEHQSKNGKWLRSYALGGFVSLVVSAALSPIVLQGWMVVIVLHAATIPVIAWADQKWSGERVGSGKLMGAAGYVVLEIVLILVLAHGSYIFDRFGPLPEGLDPGKKTELMRIIPHPR